MRGGFFALLFFVGMAALARADQIQPKNIADGKVVPASVSPDKKYCLMEVFWGDTTGTSVIFTTAGRVGNLGLVRMYTEWATDRPYKDRLSIVWSPDSARVAIYDSLHKHSEVSIYRIAGGRFERMPTHDLLVAACGRWGVSRESVVSSGQRPLRWSAEDIVEVEVSAKLKDGGTRRAILPVHAPRDGRSIQQ